MRSEGVVADEVKTTSGKPGFGDPYVNWCGEPPDVGAVAGGADEGLDKISGRDEWTLPGPEPLGSSLTIAPHFPAAAAVHMLLYASTPLL
jgi:hypothetical protein